MGGFIGSRHSAPLSELLLHYLQIVLHSLSNSFWFPCSSFASLRNTFAFPCIASMREHKAIARECKNTSEKKKKNTTTTLRGLRRLHLLFKAPCVGIIHTICMCTSQGTALLKKAQCGFSRGWSVCTKQDVCVYVCVCVCESTWSLGHELWESTSPCV